MESPQKSMICDGSDPDFVWQDYLDDTKSAAAPSAAFTHVEYSLESGFKVGMKLEIPNSESADTYWIASVVMTCGDLLTLRYFGYEEERSADFWFNIKSGEFHPIGWSLIFNKKLYPPKAVLEKNPNVEALLSKNLQNTKSIPAYLSKDLEAGLLPIDQIKCGMYLEVIEKMNPQNVWITKIIQNVGGRLFLRYEGNEKGSVTDFWLFYLSDQLLPVGGSQIHSLVYSPPIDLKTDHSEEEWKQILQNALKEDEKIPFPSHVFEPKIPIEKHNFEVGMKLEAINVHNYSDICPATVTKIVNDYYILVTIDSYEDGQKCIFSCHANSPLIFPVGWAAENGLDLVIPKGYDVKINFSWNEYLNSCNAKTAKPELFSMVFMNMGFELDMKLEAVDPFCPNNIHAATVTKICDPLIWLRFDSDESNNKTIISCVNSLDIFPVGWCASNSYPLKTPIYKHKLKINTSVVSKENIKSVADMQVMPPLGQQCKSWCPKIYFNHRCFTGPLLSKSRLAELPQAIGPGPLHLVIQDVIYRVVNIAYKSSRVLQILQVSGKLSPGMQPLIIKAKYKGKTNRATIEVIRNSEQVEEFCKSICQKLECCHHLFGPIHVGEVCPSSCQTQTKTKFGYHFVKKKKVGRPPLHSYNSSSNSNTPAAKEDKPPTVFKKGPGRKKKRKHWTHLYKQREEVKKSTKSEDSSETEDTSKSDSKEKIVGKKKLKYTPSSSIVTRGAKLPNFGLWHHHVTSFHSFPRRGRPRTRRPSFPPRKVGRPVGSTKKAIALLKHNRKSLEEVEPEIISKPEVSKSVMKHKPFQLESNPLDWSVEDVVQYLQKTDYAPLAPLLKEQEIDGQALLMLNILNIQEYLHLKPEPAKRFCYLIKDLKIEYFSHYNTS